MHVDRGWRLQCSPPGSLALALVRIAEGETRPGHFYTGMAVCRAHLQRLLQHEVLRELADANELCRRINTSYDAYRTKAVAYGDASEREMLRLRVKNRS